MSRSTDQSAEQDVSFGHCRQWDGAPCLCLGVSSCLLGNPVRYDGGHKRDRYLTDVLGRFTRWVPVCPEAETGLGIPREAMRLEGDPASPRLVTHKSKEDITPRMVDWALPRLEELESEDLCGFVFKAKSPSSGMARIKVFQENGHPVHNGTGIFAGLFMKRFPDLPVEDEGRLNDPNLRENFLDRAFAMARWHEMLRENPTPGGLVDFHTRHKLLLMAHSPKHYRELGTLTANLKAKELDEVRREYLSRFMEGMKLTATRKKHRNVLSHVMGYFKKQLSGDEKQELLEVVEEYARGLIPLIVPVTLLNHHVRKYGQEYLGKQVYLRPHPAELKLRNHA